jgi:hypothetical protein
MVCEARTGEATNGFVERRGAVGLLCALACLLCCLKNPQTPPAPGQSGASCVASGDCAAGLACPSGTCMPGAASGSSCVRSETCNSGLTCRGGSCAPLAADGAPCTTFSDCSAQHVCVGGKCAHECNTGADCPQGTYCVEQACLGPCTGSFLFGGGDSGVIPVVCVNGVPTGCPDAPAGTYCSKCGCGLGTRCDTATETCGPQLANGSPCSVAQDCTSANCGLPDGTADAAMTMQCLDGAGAPCSNRPCGSCDGPGCARGCSSDLDCPLLDGLGKCHPGGERYWPCLSGPGGSFCRHPCTTGVGNECPAGTACDPYMPEACSDYAFTNACVPP